MNNLEKMEGVNAPCFSFGEFRTSDPYKEIFQEKKEKEKVVKKAKMKRRMKGTLIIIAPLRNETSRSNTKIPSSDLKNGTDVKKSEFKFSIDEFPSLFDSQNKPVKVMKATEKKIKKDYVLASKFSDQSLEINQNLKKVEKQGQNQKKTKNTGQQLVRSQNVEKTKQRKLMESPASRVGKIPGLVWSSKDQSVETLKRSLNVKQRYVHKIFIEYDFMS